MKISRLVAYCKSTVKIGSLSQDLPWFERPNAINLIKNFKSHYRVPFREWLDDGYFILPNFFNEDLLDACAQDFDRIIEGPEFPDDFCIEALPLPFCDYLLRSEVERSEIRKSAGWRTHGFYRFSRAAHALFFSPELIRIVSDLLQVQAEPRYSINFYRGTQQELHQDMAVFYVQPKNYLVGAWIALEDITEDSGPLVLYPGSHKEPMFAQFDYPRINLKNASKDEVKAYRSWVEHRAKEKYTEKKFIGKKGDVLLWHGMLIHGGGRIQNANATRRSMVVHFVPPGFDRIHEAKGPFNW